MGKEEPVPQLLFGILAATKLHLSQAQNGLRSQIQMVQTYFIAANHLSSLKNRSLDSRFCGANEREGPSGLCRSRKC